MPEMSIMGTAPYCVTRDRFIDKSEWHRCALWSFDGVERPVKARE
jgi:hypothetical protein